MKRMIALMAVLTAFAFLPCETFATEPASGYTSVSRHFNFKNFDRIAASYSWQVDVVFADTYSVDVEVPDFIEPYLKVKNVSGKLVLSLEKLPSNVKNKLNNSKGRLQATVTMPTLTAVDLSGASRLSANGAIDLHQKSLDIDISGASQLDELHVKGVDRLSIDLSGATGCNLTVYAEEMHIDVSGSSRLEWKGTALRAFIDCSGASGIQMAGEVGRMNIDCSGASKVVSTGETEIASVELSGASKCEVAVSGKLDYELSGATTLRVRDLGAAVTGEMSRGAKIVYVK